jgi:DHA1 family bicyclomycin/chloramphenicol resistance-like MFS transporter
MEGSQPDLSAVEFIHPKNDDVEPKKRQLILKLGIDRLFYIGTCITAASGVVLVVNVGFGLGGIAGVAVPLLIFIAMNGLIVANSVASALDLAPQKAGTTSSLIGAMHYGSGVISAAILSFFADGTPWAMSAIIAVAGIGSLVSATLLRQSLR